MRIAEIYESTQGEGGLTGTRSVFLRTSGCNLRCWFCDTPFTSWQPEGEDFSVDEMVARVTQYESRHIVITGGEPMLFSEMIPLCERLANLNKHITIETAGTLYLPLRCDLMSLSPKLSNSAPSQREWPQWFDRHERSRHAPGVVQRLLTEYHCQLKFVVNAKEDCDEVLGYLKQFPNLPRGWVHLMPQGTNLEELREISAWLEPYCREHELQFCPRKHIEWFGFQRGT